MHSIVQNKKRIFHETHLNHFKENKVEIANAIKKPFPFLESLRDHSFITEKIYNDSLEACQNLVPVKKVVYHILCHLEKVFDESLLQVLFCRPHLKQYPDLIQIHRSFENVVPDKLLSWESDREETHKMPNTQPSCEQGAALPELGNQVQPCAVDVPGTQETSSFGDSKMSKESQRARPAADQGPEIIVGCCESRVEEAPREVQHSAPRRGPGEECADGQPGASGV